MLRVTEMPWQWLVVIDGDGGDGGGDVMQCVFNDEWMASWYLVCMDAHIHSSHRARDGL
jgi:hypothetical protein